MNSADSSDSARPGPARPFGGPGPAVLLALATLLIGAGCRTIQLRPINEHELRDRALMGLKDGAGYPHDPLVRAQAIEALGDVAPDQAARYALEALRDPHPAVRFAACMALGTIGYSDAKDLLRLRAEDENGSVQAAAIFALHRLGDTSRTSLLADKLLRDPDVHVRRNAALVLGELGEPGSVRLLKHAAQDRDESVMLQATEAMAFLGDGRARQQLAVQAHDGAGHRQVLALIAMGRIGDPRFISALKLRLRDGPHLETKLAAARALGQFGRDDGLKLALKAVSFRKPDQNLPEDLPETQIMRIRSMAALALGAIGDRGALPALCKRLDAQDDPRVQLAAAKAILEILNQDMPWNTQTDNAARRVSHNR